MKLIINVFRCYKTVKFGESNAMPLSKPKEAQVAQLKKISSNFGLE